MAGDALAQPETGAVATAGSNPTRLVSLDAYRGAVMFLMMAEVFHFSKVSGAFPGNALWQSLADAQTHRAWRGCSLHDMIQPSFSFLVGAALPFSLAARRRRGESFNGSLVHAAWRSMVLILLGVALRSVGKPQTYWTFEDTLSQIGLGYLPLFVLGHATPTWRWGAFVALVVGYWAAFALYPVAEPGFDWSAVGVPPDWALHERGFATHWDKNSNLAWAFDRWFLNLFPREQTFLSNRGGYATLSFIPTLATMLLGTLTADELRDGRSITARVRSLVGKGVVLLGLGLAAEWLGLCPIVKRIWTPAWVLFSGGWCFLALAGFHLILDQGNPMTRRFVYPLVAIGRNSILAYLIAHLINDFVLDTFRTHLGRDLFSRWGAYETLISGTVLMAVYLAILIAMDRRRIYLKI